MKKIMPILLLLIIAAGGFFGWRYYVSTYVGDIYYTVVPSGIEKEDIKSDNGEVLGKGYEYNLTAYNKDGKALKVSFNVITEGEYKRGNGYAEGTYLKVEASEKRVLSQEVVEESQVPNNVLQLLNK